MASQGEPILGLTVSQSDIVHRLAADESGMTTAQFQDRLSKEEEFKNEEKAVDIALLHFLRNKHPEHAPSTPPRPRQGTPKSSPVPTPSVPRADLEGEYEGVEGERPADIIQQQLDAIIAESSSLPKEDHDSGKAPAPFFCLLQSTGYGKTRAVIELAKVRRVVYLLWRDIYGSWRRPEVVRRLLREFEDETDEATLERKWSKFVDSVMETAAMYPTAQELLNAQYNDGCLNGKFYTKLLEVWEKKTTPARTPLKSSMADSSQSPPSKKRMKTSSGARKVHYTSDHISKDWLILCLDEASGLPSLAYRAYRRIAKEKECFSIFADTAASICEFMPPNDASSDIREGYYGKFYPPIVNFATLDLFWNEKALDNNYSNLFFAGRPRWKKEYHKFMAQFKDEKKSLQELIDLATELLLAPCYEKDKKWLKLNSVDLPMIALFTCRFSLGPRSKLAKLLAKYSLATIKSVSETRDVIETTYVSEPLLAEASARYTAESEKNLFNVLENVHSAFQTEEVLLDAPRGDIGEMCAAALLGLGMDSARVRTKRLAQQTYMSEPVPLKDFLRELGLEISERDLVEGWDVNFTHFCRPDWDVCEREIKGMWKRRLAYYVPAGLFGLDLLIAMKKTNEAHFGVIRVQVKNHSLKINASARKVIFEKLLPSCCPPVLQDEKLSISLLLSVNEVDFFENILYRRNDGKYTPPKAARTTRRSIISSQAEGRRVVLELAMPFPSENPKVSDHMKRVSSKLKEICAKTSTNEPDDWISYYGKKIAAATVDPLPEQTQH